MYVFALRSQNFVIWTKAFIKKSLFCQGKLTSSNFIFWRFFLILKTYWQSFLLVNLIVTVERFLLILWLESIRSGGISQPSLPSLITELTIIIAFNL